MQYINTIPLNGRITVYTGIGSRDTYGKFASYTKTEHNAAIFKKTKHSRDNFQIETSYTHVAYVKDVVDKDALVYLGTTTETDPTEVESKEIQEFSPMENVVQNVVGYKLWL